MRKNYVLILLGLVLATYFVVAHAMQPISNTSIEKKPLFNTQKTTVVVAKSQTNWLKVVQNIHLNSTDFIQKYQADFQLTEADELRRYRSETDELGFTHHRYQQYYKGLKVIGGELLFHEKNGRVRTINGQVAQQLNVEVIPSISKEKAIQIALEEVPAERYSWEDEGTEKMLQDTKEDEKATFYPNAELILADKNFTQSGDAYRLCYQLVIYALKPLARQQLWIDAHTGEVYHSISLVHTIHNTHGTAVTKYSGKQEIVTDSISANEYRLEENKRGKGIVTYNMQQKTIYGESIPFEDEDNIWTNFNEDQDEAATDAHWGSEMVYDFLAQKFNYLSFDNRNSKIASYVHYDWNYFNAFWNGSWATYGDGDGSSFPLTTLDIVAHELTHGITDYTAALVYQNEPGALNESFSDILGVSVEFWANPIGFNWQIGEQVRKSGVPLRDMADPNLRGDPKYYKGKNWFSGRGDNGGVHTNSGVQNHWFYLLSEGGEIITEEEDTFNIKGIGVDEAIKIAFRNLRYYLTVSSQYSDAREGAIQSAEDLYGVCSLEYLETAKAWAAVGVGNPISDNDLKMINVINPLTDCGLSDSEQITVQFRYNGCGEALKAGEKIPFTYSVDSTDIITDTLILTERMVGGDTLTFTFSQPADFSELGEHSIDCSTVFEKDQEAYNNTETVVIENRFQQNIDIGIVEVVAPVSQCYLSATEELQVEFGFFGCDSLAANTPIVVAYDRLGWPNTVRDTIVLDYTIYEGETFTYTFKDLLNISYSGSYLFNFWAEFAIDTMNRNDSIRDYVVKTPFNLQNQNRISFEDPVFSLDSIVLHTNKQSDVYISENAKYTGQYGFEMTGGNLFEEEEANNWLIPDGTDNWLVNEVFSAMMCFCVDATAMSTVTLRFDLKQQYSELYGEFYGLDLTDASSLRVLAEGQQVSDTYTPTTTVDDPFVTHEIALDEYAGTTFEICFESRNFIHADTDLSEFDIDLYLGDVAYLDNIYINSYVVGVNDLVEDISNEKINLSIYPNPNNGIFTLHYQSNANIVQEPILIELFDMQGKRVQVFDNQKFESDYLNHHFNINLSVPSLAKGIYLVKITQGQESVSKRMILLE